MPLRQFFRMSLLVFVTGCLLTAAMAESHLRPPAGGRRIVVTPNGPQDGGDFGPKTPGTLTSGLQEAFDLAKASCRDVYIEGGNWTVGQTAGVVYATSVTLRIPWMQNFHLDGGNYVISYRGKTGDAVVIDSQMSCTLRFGLIVSHADGAVVRLKASSVGPDKFKVITCSRFFFNALVGGGGAWPGGTAFNSQLDPKWRRKGTGLLLDGTEGGLIYTQVHAMEIVGCEYGVRLEGNVNNNQISSPFVHLCHTHVQVGPQAKLNQLDFAVNSEGIPESVGARLLGSSNRLTLSSSGTSPGNDLLLEGDARDNFIQAVHLPHGYQQHSTEKNLIHFEQPEQAAIATPPVPGSAVEQVNTWSCPVLISILSPGVVQSWSRANGGKVHAFSAPLFSGQQITLLPGDRLVLNYTAAPTWNWEYLP